MTDLENEDEEAALRESMIARMVTDTQGCADARTIAERLHLIVRDRAHFCGQRPDVECALWTPAEVRQRQAPHGRCYVVNWEAGPHDWGVSASLALMRSLGRLVETYYGFDLCIYLDE